MSGWSVDFKFDPTETLSCGGGVYNYPSYCNLQADSLSRAALTTLDRALAKPLWDRYQEVIHQDQPYTFLTNNKTLRFFDKRIKNVELSKLGLNYEHLNGGMMPWFVPKSEQRRNNN